MDAFLDHFYIMVFIGLKYQTSTDDSRACRRRSNQSKISLPLKSNQCMQHVQKDVDCHNAIRHFFDAAYDCISHSTFVSMSLNDLEMCGHSVVQPSKAGAPGRRV
jgi:hypothetical protein